MIILELPLIDLRRREETWTAHVSWQRSGRQILMIRIQTHDMLKYL